MFLKTDALRNCDYTVRVAIVDTLITNHTASAQASKRLQADLAIYADDNNAILFQEALIRFAEAQITLQAIDAAKTEVETLINDPWTLCVQSSPTVTTPTGTLAGCIPSTLSNPGGPTSFSTANFSLPNNAAYNFTHQASISAGQAGIRIYEQPANIQAYESPPAELVTLGDSTKVSIVVLPAGDYSIEIFTNPGTSLETSCVYFEQDGGTIGGGGGGGLPPI